MLVGCSNKTAATSQPAKVAKIGEYASVAALSNIKTVISEDSGITLQDEVNMSKSTSFDSLTPEEQIWLEMVLEGEGMSAQDVLAGNITVEAADKEQESMIETYILAGSLPSNAKEVLAEYKQQTGYYEQFTEEHHQKPVVAEQKSEQEQNTPKPATTSPAKPQASESQQIKQVEANQATNDGGGLMSYAEKKAAVERSGGRVVSEEEFYKAAKEGDKTCIEDMASDGMIYAIFD